MPSQHASKEFARVKRMLRTIKAGDRVRATAYAGATSQGKTGTVVDPDPNFPVRRVKVRWDDGTEIAVLPTSIEEEAP